MDEVKHILSGLKTADWWTKRDMIRRLLDFPPERYAVVLESWLRDDGNADLRGTAMEIFRCLGSRALSPLFSLLADADADVRIFAANVLGDIGESGSVEALVSALADPVENVRAASAEALGKIGDELALAALESALGDTEWVAMAAIEAIGRIGGERAASLLCECLDREDYREMACTALEQSGDSLCMGTLLSHARSGGPLASPALRAYVIVAEREEEYSDPSHLSQFVPRLIDLLSSHEEVVRRAAVAALGRAEDARCLPQLLEALKEDSLQEQALRGILSLGSKALPGVIEALAKPGSNRVVLAKVVSMSGAPERLLPFACDSDPEVRTEVALAIGAIRTPVAEKALLTLETDAVEEVRAAARLSLGNYRRMP